ncbi:MAG: hypothetical protein IKY52_05315 [Clostridia bacterium]|nr:hypothetical protein [Clostridia bacterium]
MKKTLTMLTAALMAAVLCVSAGAAFSAKYECEDGVITGAAKEYKDGNIQDVSIASGGKIVGLGGVNDAPQMASFVTWSVEVPVDGVYDITFAYDTDNASEKGASVIVDGERYDVPIDISVMPEKYGLETQYWTMDAELTAGVHEIAVTTSEDFNRDANFGPVVKSVNADYIEIVLVKEIVIAPEVTDVPEEITAAPQTFDMGIIAAAAAVVSAAGYMISKKR